MRNLFQSSMILGLLLLAGAAPAQPGSVETAKQLFKEAVALEAQGSFGAAEQKLREALAVKETPGLRYHLAYCEAEQGKLVEALADYDRAQALIDGGVAAPDVQSLLTTARADVLRRMSDLTLQLPARIQRFEVVIDGQAVPMERGKPININPGSHQVELRAEGYRPFLTSVDMGEADHRTLALDPVPLPPAPVAPPPAPVPVSMAGSPGMEPAAPSSSARLPVLIAEGGIVAIGLGLGIGGLLWRSSASDRRESAAAELDQLAPGEDSICAGADSEPACAELEEAQADHTSATTLTNVGFIAAGVGALALAGTFLFWPADSKSGALRRPAVHTAIGPRGVFAGVRAAF